MHVKKGDTVVILAGKDKGRDGKVLTATPKNNRVVVEGINVQKHHTKPKSAQQTGGILEQAGPIDASNVMVVCPKCKKPTRIAHAFDAEGNKYRCCKKCGENLDRKTEKAVEAKTAKKKEKKEKAAPQEEQKAE